MTEVTTESEMDLKDQALPMWIWGATAFVATYAMMFVIR